MFKKAVLSLTFLLLTAASMGVAGETVEVRDSISLGKANVYVQGILPSRTSNLVYLVGLSDNQSVLWTFDPSKKSVAELKLDTDKRVQQLFFLGEGRLATLVEAEKAKKDERTTYHIHAIDLKSGKLEKTANERIKSPQQFVVNEEKGEIIYISSDELEDYRLRTHELKTGKLKSEVKLSMYDKESRPLSYPYFMRLDRGQSGRFYMMRDSLYHSSHYLGEVDLTNGNYVAAPNRDILRTLLEKPEVSSARMALMGDGGYFEPSKEQYALAVETLDPKGPANHFWHDIYLVVMDAKTGKHLQSKKVDAKTAGSNGFISPPFADRDGNIYGILYLDKDSAKAIVDLKTKF